MIVRSAVGGVYKIASLGLVLNPGDSVDLSFIATPEKIANSKELRVAIMRGYLKVVDSTTGLLSHVNFSPSVQSVASSFSKHPSIRRAVFIEEISARSEFTFADYILRSKANKVNIVSYTSDSSLLREIIVGEIDISLVDAARGRLEKVSA